MKHLALLFCATLLAFTVPAPSARADVSVSVDFFYDALDPYGDWVYTPDYGYVWQPVAAQQPSWAPYSDGYWAYTDAGWTWISEEDFGWATYHYGRWVRMNHRWTWVPGYEWAPAWVSWRQSDDYVGWAPLPPEARWFVNIGFSSWSDSHYDIGPSYYNFVPMNRFSSRSSLNPYIMDRSRNVTVIDRSVNITNITYRDNVVNNIFVGGPDVNRMDRLGGSPIRRLNLRRDEDSFRRDWVDGRRGDRDGRDFRGDRDGRGPRGFGSLSRIENDDLLVAAPSIRRNETAELPRRVRDNIERPEIDRGWRDAGDAKALDRLRERHREEISKISPDKIPDKKPLVVTGNIPPKVLDRVRPGEDRNAGLPRPGPRGTDEEVRKGMPQRPDAPKGVQDQPPTAADSKKGKGGLPDRTDMPKRDGRPDRLPEADPRTVPGRGPDGDPRTPGMRPDSDPRRIPGVRPDGDSRTPDGRPGGEPRKMPDRVLPGQPSIPGQPGNADRTPDKPVIPGKPKSRPVVPPEDTPPRRSMPPETPPGGGSITPTPKKGPGPDMPDRKSGREPEIRRSIPSVPDVKPRVAPAPMPQPEVKPRVAPMPKAESPRTPPRPMPQPRERPSVPQPPKAAPSPLRSAPPQVRSAPPQVRSAPPQVRPAPAPKARPAPVARPAPGPSAAPKPAAVPPAKKKDPRR